MPESIDPLTVVLESVRVVGGDFCWPATEVLDVLDAFERLDRVVLGAELWRFDAGEAPTVIGWTDYEVPDGPHRGRVASARQSAAEELLGHVGDRDAWVNLQWEQTEDPGA